MKTIVKKIIKNKDKYIAWAARPSSVQRNALLTPVINKLIDSDYLILANPNGVHEFYCQEKKLNAYFKKLKKQLSKPQTVKKHFAQYEKVKKELLAASKIPKQPKKLLPIFNKYCQALEKYSPFFMTPYAIEAVIEPELSKKLGDKFEIIANPTIVFGYQKYQLAVAKKTDPKKIVNRYKWLNEYSYKEKLLDLSQVKSEKIDPDIFKLPQAIKNHRQKYQKLLKYITDPKLKALVELGHGYVNLRTERIEIFKQAQTNFRQFYQLLSKKSGLDYLQVISMTNPEIINLIKDKKVNVSLADRRKKDNFIIYKSPKDKKATFIYQLSTVKKIINSFHQTKKTKIIKGIPAYPGNIKGKVQIIKDLNDLKKFKAGNILISRFTNPSYTPILKKAKAIITDEGGITCHASIVSRELKIPCIVGTKQATQIFKNGDILEINANQGIVKKL